MSIINWFKNTFTVLREAGKIKEYEKISTLTEENANLKSKLLIVEQEIATLNEEMNQKRKLEYRNESYWDNDDGPYCSRCFDELGKTIRIHPNYIGSNFSTCPKCKTRVNITGRSDFVQTSTPSRKNPGR